MMFSPVQCDPEREASPVTVASIGGRAESGRILPQFEEDQCSTQFLLDVLQHRFTFLGETHAMGKEIDWLANPSVDIEWQIMLHKFYFAPGLARQYLRTKDIGYRDCFERLVTGWISQTDPGFIASDVTARRVQNWIYAWQQFNSVDSDPFSCEFRDALLGSLEIQVNYILEHMAAARNHRTMSLFAIFLAGVALPRIEASAAWRTYAAKEMEVNIETDLLPDGVHCELSTDYHHIVLRSYLLFLQIAAMNDIRVSARARQSICRALDFAMHIHRPDGLIPALSDSDSRSYLSLLDRGAELFERDDYAFVAAAGSRGTPPQQAKVLFRDSGYVVLRSDWKSSEAPSQARYLVFDAGPIGAGNHGHLDSLNIEVAAYGRSLIVDPGRYTYDEQGRTNWRARFRGTAAHNTVTVNGTDQAIYQYRPSRKKKVILKPHPETSLLACDLDDRCAYVHGRVSSPTYSAVHHRHIWFYDNRYWVILDRMIAPCEHRYDLRFQLTVEAQDRVSMEKSSASTTVTMPGMSLLLAGNSTQIRLEDSYVSSRYGSKHDAPRLCAHQRGSNASFISVLYPERCDSAALHCSVSNGYTEIVVTDRSRHDAWRFSIAKQSARLQSRDLSGHWNFVAEDHHG